MFVSSKFSSIFYMLPKKWGGDSMFIHFLICKFKKIVFCEKKLRGGGSPHSLHPDATCLLKRVDLKIGCFFKKENAANKCILTDRRSEDKRQKFLNETAFSWMI